MSDKEEELAPEVAALVNTLMLASTQSNRDTYKALFESFQISYEKERARVDLIRARIKYLCNQPYIPNINLFMDAIYPDEADIEKMAENAIKQGKV